MKRLILGGVSGIVVAAIIMQVLVALVELSAYASTLFAVSAGSICCMLGMFLAVATES